MQIAKYQQTSNVLIHVATSSIALLVTSYSLYVPKIVEFYRPIQLLQAKMKRGVV